MDIPIRPFEERDLNRIVEIALAAWVPVFESFAELLGPDLFRTVYPDWQADKKEQVTSACAGDHPVDVWVAERDDRVVGFITVHLNHKRRIGEIGNNAVHPDCQGQGIGTTLYEFALQQMRDAGMEAAEVGTGGDSSHAPARRAYEKAGFDRAVPGVTYYQDLRTSRRDQPGGGSR